MTIAAERAIDMALHEKVQNMPGLPWWTTPIQREIITPLFKLTAIGGLPASVRERFDIPWGLVEAAELKALELWVRETWRFTPRPLRWAPRASEGWRRESRAQRERDLLERRFRLPSIASAPAVRS